MSPPHSINILFSMQFWETWNLCSPPVQETLFHENKMINKLLHIFSVIKACLNVGNLIQLLVYVAGSGGERTQPHCVTGASRDGNADPPARKPLSGRKNKGLGEEGA